MSERLQELPPPLGRQTSPKQDAEGFSFPQDMDTDAAEPSQVCQTVGAHSQLQTHQFMYMPVILRLYICAILH